MSLDFTAGSSIFGGVRHLSAIQLHLTSRTESAGTSGVIPEGGSKSPALWFEAPRRAVLRFEPVPPPGRSEVTIRALYSLVSAGSEMHFYRGETGLAELLTPTTKGTAPFPISFGYQTVGVIDAAGAESGFHPGQLVFAMHPHQSLFTVLPADARLQLLPEGYDPLKAVFATLFSVALQTLLVVPVRPGDCVVVSGLGIVGTFTAFLARRNAGSLVLVDPLPSRRERAAWLGAEHIICPEELSATVAQASNGRGVDVFIETSGAAPALQSAIRATGEQGTIAVSSWYGGRKVGLFLSPEFHLRSQKIVSCMIRNLPDHLAARWSPERRFAAALDLLSTIDVSQLISHQIAFSRAPDAYSLIDSRPEDTLAVVLVH